MASKLKKMFGSIAQFALPAIGYAVGGPVGAGVGGAVGGAVSGTGSAKRAVSGGLQGFGGGSIAKGAGVPSFSGGGSSGGGISSFLSSLFGGGNAYASSAPMNYASNASKLSNVSPWLNPMASASAMNPSSALTNFTTGSSPLSSGGGSLNRLKSLFGGNKLLTTGLGLAGASQLIRSPEVPELPQSVQDYQSMVRGGGSAINQQAQSALSTELGRPFEQVSAEEEQAALRQLEKDQKLAEDQVRDTYRNLRPGTSPDSDSAFRRDLADVQDRFAKTKTDTVTQLRRQVSNDFQGNRIRQILAAQGIDQQQMQNLLSANQYDVDRMLKQLNIDDRDKQYLRNYLLNFGGNMVASQLGTQQSSGSSALEQLLAQIGGGE